METPAQQKDATPTTEQEPAPAKKLDATVHQHDSNPFTTTLSGIKKLFKLNTGSLTATSLFSLLLTILAGFSGAAVAIALVLLLIKGSSISSLYFLQLGPEITEYLSTVNDTMITTSLFLGPVLFIVFMTLSQLAILKLLAVNSEGQHIGFGDVFRQSFKRTLPFLGLVALITLTCALTVVVMALLAQIVGMLIFVLGIIAFIAALYVSTRISMAPFSVVHENMGPIASLKRSWGLTKGHFGEVLGITAATFAIAFVPVIIIDLLALASQPNPAVSSVFSTVAFVVSFFATAVAMSGFSERYTQLRNIAEGKATATKTHPANYIAIVLVIVISVIAGLVAPKSQADPFNSPTTEQELQQYLDDLRESEGLPPETTLPEVQPGEEQYEMPTDNGELYPEETPHSVN